MQKAGIVNKLRVYPLPYVHLQYQEQIRQKNYRMRSFPERLHVRFYTTEDAGEVLNINTPEDLQSLSPSSSNS